MPGDPNTGDVSLQIKNLTVSDAGEYECQVTPSIDQPLLRRKTWLQVIGTSPFNIHITSKGAEN